MRAVVVGAGIAGLASAIALTRSGWDVEVLERAPVLTEVGAGISLWPNALGALAALGLEDQVRDRARVSTSHGIRDRRGRFLSRTDGAELRARYGDLLVVHRAELHAVLRDALPTLVVHPGRHVIEVESDGVVRYSGAGGDGVTSADLVVAADGLRSGVRSMLWPRVSPVYAGYTAWRFVTRVPVSIEGDFESWGRGERFGCAELRDGRIYCFAVSNAQENSPDVPLAGPGGLRERFAGWHDPIPRLLAATEPGAVLHHDLYSLPPLSSYVKDQVVLVGDAAHAMTPDLGQGACQALEDAVALAATAPDLALYDAKRRPRAAMISARSTRTGRAAQWSSPMSSAIRNTALRLMPDSALLRSLSPVLIDPNSSPSA